MISFECPGHTKRTVKRQPCALVKSSDLLDCNSLSGKILLRIMAKRDSEGVQMEPHAINTEEFRSEGKP